MNQFKTKTEKVFILIGFIILTGCALPSLSKFSVDETDMEEVFKSTSVVTLNWLDTNTTTIQSYKVYYKAHGESTWIILDTISASMPLFEITNSTIGNGIWDFGVSAVDDLGNESEIHSSLDLTADPSGWYLLWAN